MGKAFAVAQEDNPNQPHAWDEQKPPYLDTENASCWDSPAPALTLVASIAFATRVWHRLPTVTAP